MPDFDDDPLGENSERGPSKSELKREKQALQDLGKEIMALPKGIFQRLPLSEDMREAMALYLRLKQNEARRRQLQFIGKHMQNEDVAAIQGVLEQVGNESKIFRQHFHRLEQLRDQLIAEGDSALGAALEEFPDLNRQELRTLIRQAHKERAEHKPPAASRKLFRYLREHTGIGDPG